ncbi:uncharacterized protein C8orf76 homolog isoform X2 [Cygnus olor]|uniref:uncharacterized protein C8orf76 homolog isoform X2 n=1 Tax=Cygnus olor TaxID=8869 RepID=UPI001ADE977F|nr:uncharacterized protein C8orf76 homolog isoform X2 [Cygnus olor]
MEAATEPPLGCEFAESLFSGGRERGAGGGAGQPYCAKRCEPRWFCGETGGEEDAEILTGNKFRADLAYRERQFEKSLCEYSSCLLRLPPGNIAMRRDVQEGQARCLSQLGRHKEALDIAEKMRSGATNTDHLTTVLNLQFAIYQDLKNVEKKMLCLQQLICLHPFNPWYWKLLAEAYTSLLESLSPLRVPETNTNRSEEVGVSDSRSKISAGREIHFQPHRSASQREGLWSSLATETKSENTGTCNSSQAVKETLCASHEPERKDKGKEGASEPWEQSVSREVGIKACASFIRARLLLQLTQSQQASFALENNMKSQKEIDGKVAQFGLSETSSLLLSEVMGADLIPEKLKEEFQGEVKCIGSSALSSLVTASASEFETKWFGELQEDSCHSDGQFYSDTHSPPLAT